MLRPIQQLPYGSSTISSGTNPKQQHINTMHISAMKGKNKPQMITLSTNNGTQKQQVTMHHLSEDEQLTILKVDEEDEVASNTDIDNGDNSKENIDINDIAKSTSYNGINLVNEAASLTFQVGEGTGDTMAVSLSELNMGTLFAVSTANNADAVAHSSEVLGDTTNGDIWLNDTLDLCVSFHQTFSQMVSMLPTKNNSRTIHEFPRVSEDGTITEMFFLQLVHTFLMASEYAFF